MELIQEKSYSGVSRSSHASVVSFFFATEMQPTLSGRTHSPLAHSTGHSKSGTERRRGTVNAFPEGHQISIVLWRNPDASSYNVLSGKSEHPKIDFG